MIPSPAVADVGPAFTDASLTSHENTLIQQALSVLEQRLFQRGPCLANPSDVRDYLRMRLAPQDREVFAVLYLDNRHRVLAFEPLFQGTIDGAPVYPRVVLKRAIEHNCAALILAHNHPSGVTQPSHADRTLTKELKDLLAEVEIRVLDHFIIGQGKPYSFAEAGLL